MLRLPDLDDKTFKQIVEESKRMISSVFPDWTDENYHDPGITLIELFAWLTEMQNYYLNRITVKNELKFLKLLGIQPEEQISARADVTFEQVESPFILPKGTGVSAGEQYFETEESVLLTPIRVEKMMSYVDGIFTDYSSINASEGTTFFPFGRRVKAGHSLYIGLDGKLDAMKEFRLSFHLYEDYPVPCLKPDGWQNDFIPSARVAWEYCTYDESMGKTVWKPLDVLEDGTIHLSFSGKLVFRFPADISKYKLNSGHSDESYWIRGTVIEAGYEIPPRLRTVRNNTVAAIQRQTLVEYRDFSSNGAVSQIIRVEGYLPYYGICEVQVRERDGCWITWDAVEDMTQASPEDCCYCMKKNEESKTVEIMFGDGKNGRIPMEGADCIRVISCHPSFIQHQQLGAGTGLPNQIYTINGITGIFKILKKSFRLQVGEWCSDKKRYQWYDWHGVEDFDASGNQSRHFILDTQESKIIFGNNEKGILPEKSDRPNIRIISCQVGGGENGNVKENEIHAVASGIEQQVAVRNYCAAVGGRESETMDDAKRRLRLELKKQYRAVTSADYEKIVRNTPGLRVARVKALPLYEKGLKDYPRHTVPAKVTVVVMPYSEEGNPVPSQGFLDTVKLHLDRYRLITTEIDVIPPEYIKVTVHGSVVVAPHIKLAPERIEEVLYKLLDPINDTDAAQGWDFGRTVSKGDIFSEISKIDGVEYIKELWIHAEGEGIRKDISGDIYIPPYGLVYSGQHEIEIISKTEL